MAIRGQERAGYGPAAAASAVCWPSSKQKVLGAPADLESARVKCGKGRERGGGTRLTLPFRGKHHDENWAMAVRPGLDSQLNHFLDV